MMMKVEPWLEMDKVAEPLTLHNQCYGSLEVQLLGIQPLA
jgi:hypothetical protein